MSLTLSHPLFTLRDINHIIFDKDGTITDSNVYWCEIIRRRVHALANIFPLNASQLDEIQISMGSSGTTLSPNGPIALKSRSFVLKVVVDKLRFYGINTSLETVSALFDCVHNEFLPESDNFVVPILPCIDFIQKLNNFDVSVSLATSDSYSNTVQVLSRLSLLDIFASNIICRDSGFGDKVNGTPAVELCRRTGSPAATSLVIGDAPMDATMASSAKLKGAVLVASGQVPYSQLEDCSKFCCNSLSELTILDS